VPGGAGSSQFFGFGIRVRAKFLERIATELEADAELIVARYQAETALPEGRARGELGRTCGQLRMFARVAREGHWVDARIDHALPDRQPLPKPDLRSMRVAIGPVAVFGASNFPLAFSVAGGDTASALAAGCPAALAAGCPVVTKVHPAHPGVSALVGAAIVRAAEAVGVHPGVFSMLFDQGIEVGEWLVDHPAIAGVGFTGSYWGHGPHAAGGGAAGADSGVCRDGLGEPVVLAPGAFTK